MILFRRKPTVNEVELARINAELDRLIPRIENLAADNTRLKAENHRLHVLLGDQRARMKAMAQERLDATTERLVERVVLAQLSPPVRPAAVDATVVLERVATS